MIMNRPITGFDRSSFDRLSLQVSEIQSLLEFLTEYGELPNKEACTVSALERLADLLQADIEAMQRAYATPAPAEEEAV